MRQRLGEAISCGNLKNQFIQNRFVKTWTREDLFHVEQAEIMFGLLSMDSVAPARFVFTQTWHVAASCLALAVKKTAFGGAGPAANAS